MITLSTFKVVLFIYRLLSLGHLVSSLLLDVFKSCPTFLSFLNIWYVLTKIFRKCCAQKRKNKVLILLFTK